MKEYSIFKLIQNAINFHEDWKQGWRDPKPKDAYDVIVIGGGGHGLATAYYLAKEHNINNVAVLEKGWLGGGNTGRNTTIIRSNYLWDESAALYEKSLQLFENLSQELNYNIMLSQRGVLNLAHNLNDLRELHRRVNAIRLNGIDSEYLNVQQVKEFVPIINTSQNIRFPIMGASLQRRGGVARRRLAQETLRGVARGRRPRRGDDGARQSTCGRRAHEKLPIAPPARGLAPARAEGPARRPAAAPRGQGRLGRQRRPRRDRDGRLCRARPRGRGLPLLRARARLRRRPAREAVDGVVLRGGRRAAGAPSQPPCTSARPKRSRTAFQSPRCRGPRAPSSARSRSARSPGTSPLDASPPLRISPCT